MEQRQHRRGSLLFPAAGRCIAGRIGGQRRGNEGFPVHFYSIFASPSTMDFLLRLNFNREQVVGFSLVLVWVFMEF